MKKLFIFVFVTLCSIFTTTLCNELSHDEVVTQPVAQQVMESEIKTEVIEFQRSIEADYTQELLASNIEETPKFAIEVIEEATIIAKPKTKTTQHHTKSKPVIIAENTITENDTTATEVRDNDAKNKPVDLTTTGVLTATTLAAAGIKPIEERPQILDNSFKRIEIVYVPIYSDSDASVDIPLDADFDILLQQINLEIRQKQLEIEQLLVQKHKIELKKSLYASVSLR